jgi:hypothetical protein
MGDGQLGWKKVKRRAGDSEERYLLRLIKTVRNNLFHGGTFANPGGPVEDPARNRPLLNACITILKACLYVSPELKEHIANVS